VSLSLFPKEASEATYALNRSTNDQKLMRILNSPDVFYLGAQIDPESRDLSMNEPVHYDSSNLTTHGIILGMTGSGKSGLGITLLEEVALDGIPQIIIDPKGDITNLLLAFPDFTGSSFQPWIPDTSGGSSSAGSTADEVAQEWKESLAQWGISPARVQALKQISEFSIYTPGIDAGLQISVLSSFAAPKDWEGNEDRYRQKISGIVSAMLSLTGTTSQPLEDPEHILTANIFEYNWSQGQDLTVSQLINQIQNPPFEKLGVLHVDDVLSDSKRQALAQTINNIIAAPTFQRWIEGAPLHMPTLLYAPDGRPRSSVFYLAHLSDNERQFFVTLLMESLLAWMHTLSGAPTLRVLVYFDEVYGFFPPAPHNPPTKEPLMRMFKQARALGIGLVMATQNAKDIDYKGLSNAGTWFIGKLLTEHDRQRVLEGMEVDAGPEEALNIDQIGKLLPDLNTREFIRYSIHDSPRIMLMKVRQTMSYLRGPLDLEQVGQLMAGQKDEQEKRPDYLHWSKGSARPPTGMQGKTGKSQTYSGRRMTQIGSSGRSRSLNREAAPRGFSPVKPSVNPAIQQYYFPVQFTADQAIFNRIQAQRQAVERIEETIDDLLYTPSLLAQVNVHYQHQPSKSSLQMWYAFIVPRLPDMPMLNWADYLSDPFDPATLSQQPFDEAYYSEVQHDLRNKAGFKALENNMVEWIYRNLPIMTYYNPEVGIYCGLQEDPDAFIIRVQTEIRQRGNADIKKMVDKYDSKYDSLDRQVQRKSSRIDAEKEELKSRKQEEMVSGAESFWRLLRGSIYRTISRVAQLRRQTSQSGEQIEVLQEDLGQFRKGFAETEAEMEVDLQEIRNKWKNAATQILEEAVTPYKKDIDTVIFGIGWVPYWATQIDGQAVILPATSSRIVEDQQVMQNVDV
jgi:hypothetical protein